MFSPHGPPILFIRLPVGVFFFVEQYQILFLEYFVCRQMHTRFFFVNTNRTSNRTVSFVSGLSRPLSDVQKQFDRVLGGPDQQWRPSRDGIAINHTVDVHSRNARRFRLSLIPRDLPTITCIRQPCHRVHRRAWPLFRRYLPVTKTVKRRLRIRRGGKSRTTVPVS